MSEGYVGITKNPMRRLNEHKTGCNHRSRIFPALQKYEDIELIILHSDLTIEEAKALEKHYRPRKEIGWNLAEGGGAPPSAKGRAILEKNKKYGDANPAKRPEVRQKISERVRAHIEKNGHHFTGKSRPEHSSLMKEKKGETYPRFKGWWVTPWGKFASYKEACVYPNGSKMSNSLLAKYCITHNEVPLSARTWSASNYFNSLGDYKPLTPKELGFRFIYKDQAS